MHIRVASKSDAKNICYIGAETFKNTYAHENQPENTEKYIEVNFAEKKVIEELNSNAIIYLLGEINEKIIGYAKLNRWHAESAVIAKNPIELEKIYIQNDFKGMGLGSKLMEESIQLAKSLTHDKLWLGVWENNIKAIKFYESHGFILIGNHIFMFGDEPQNDLLYEFQLAKG